MIINFVDLKNQYKEIKSEVDAAIQKVLDNGDYILGNSVKEFEEDFAHYCGTTYAVGVDNGTTALELALGTLGIGEGDEVITVANTFIATTLAISAVGAKIVLVDCDPDTMLMDIDKMAKAITPKTRAIIPVHLYGQMVDMYAVKAAARSKNIFVIEDASQSHGARHLLKRSGEYGDIACFSLYPAKNLGAAGDGGIIVTDNEKYYDELIKRRNYGSSVKYYHDFIGKNARLDTLQAAILNIKLKYLDRWNGKRNWVAETYHELLNGVGDLKLPATAPNNYHVWHLYVIRTERRNELQNYLKEHGVPTVIHYPIPIHKQKAYEGYDFGGRNNFPVTENLAKIILSIPMHPYLTKEEVEYITTQIKNFYNK